MKTRLLVVVITLCAARALASPPATGTNEERPLVGAIRWDAWSGGQNPIGRAVESSLGPAKWHQRLPFFAKVDGKNRVRLDGSAPATVEQEIEYATQAGLDYWTFGANSLESPMAYGLRAYLASKKPHHIKFSLMTSPNCSRLRDAAYIARLAQWMKDPRYLCVLDGRPVLYLLTWYASKENTPEEYHKAIADLRAGLRRASLPEPYLVMMNFKPSEARRWVDLGGGDAVSSYTAQGGGRNAPYAELARHAEHFWDSCKETGAQVVPVIMSGWDRRPRVEHPVPWETWQKPNEGIGKFYQPPKPEELAKHVRHALDWLKVNRSAAPAQIAIIYAWNEFDEGGWLAPTLSPDGTANLQRVEAVGGAIREWRAAVGSQPKERTP